MVWICCHFIHICSFVKKVFILNCFLSLSDIYLTVFFRRILISLSVGFFSRFLFRKTSRHGTLLPWLHYVPVWVNLTWACALIFQKKCIPWCIHLSFSYWDILFGTFSNGVFRSCVIWPPSYPLSGRRIWMY